MAVTLANIREEVRSRLAEPDEDFFTNTELNRWINLAQHDFCRDTEAMHSRWSVNVVADQRDYALPNDCISVESVKYLNTSTYDSLDYRPWNSFYEEPSTVNAGGSPSTFSMRRENTIALNPIPTSNVTNGLVVEGSQEALEMTSDTDNVFRSKNSGDSSSPYIEHYWEALVYGVLVRAYEKDKDWDSANRAKVEWLNQAGVARGRLNGKVKDRKSRKPFAQGSGRSWPNIDLGKGY